MSRQFTYTYKLLTLPLSFLAPGERALVSLVYGHGKERERERGRDGGREGEREGEREGGREREGGGRESDEREKVPFMESGCVSLIVFEYIILC